MQSNPVISNSEMQLLLLELECSLQKHDKYYDYSDDHSVWKRGEEQWKHIQSISNDLKLNGYAAEVKVAFEKYYNCK
jgi:hypothetical protein